ncbi:hypothetical protein BS47DRAFT_1384007, partial [Hydnum rufescens UP504]
MNANSSLLALPVEILIRIVGLLEGRRIARCSALQHVIESSVVLQYFIKLDMFGYTDVSGSVSAVPAMRLNRLERYVDAWNNLDWVESRIDGSLQGSSSGALSQGIFITYTDKNVYCIQLPHPTRGIPFRTWMLDDFEFGINQVQIDPSNNLLVVLSRQVSSLIGNYSSVKFASNLYFPIMVLIREPPITFFVQFSQTRGTTWSESWVVWLES